VNIKDIMWAVRTCFDKRSLNEYLLLSLRDQGVSGVHIVNDYRIGQPVTAISEFFEKTFIPSTQNHIVCIEDDALLSECFVKEVLFVLQRVNDEYGAINFSVDSSVYYIDSNSIYCPSVDLFRRKSEIHYTGTVAIHKNTAIKFCEKYPSDVPSGKSFDLKLSNICLDNREAHYITFPTLSRSTNVPSALGNTLKPKDESFTHAPVFTDPSSIDAALKLQKSMILTIKRQQNLYFG